MSSVSVELAERRHLTEIPKIELASATMFPETDLPQTIRHRVTEIHDLQDALTHKRLWVAQHNDKPIGFNFTCLTLVTFRHLAWNAPFYEKLGFQGMDPSEHGRELASLIEEEHLIGINVANRIAMRLNL